MPVVLLVDDRLGVASSYRFTLVGEPDESTHGRTRMWRVRRGVNRYMNPITRPLARRLPGFAILTHTGRKSGHKYQTPINVFKRGNHYLFFLTYGSDVEWVKNVLATGSASIETRGQVVELVEPELITDPELRAAPPHVRFLEGRIAGATEYVRMRVHRRRDSLRHQRDMSSYAR